MKHRQRLKRVIGSGFNDHPSGFFFNTATAPGVDVLPWDRFKCNGHAGECSGKDHGCQVQRVPASVWNAHAPQVWSWIMTEIRRRVRRRRPGVDVQFWKCWETQERGVLHLHAIIRAVGVSEREMREIWEDVLSIRYTMSTGYEFRWGVQQSCDRIGSKESVAELIELHGFDPAEALAEVDQADQAARLVKIRYVAKYCTKGGKRASTVHLVTGEIRDDGRGYRTWSASSRWGTTMKQVRQNQRDWCQQAAAAVATVSGAAATLPGGAEGGALDLSTDIYAQAVSECLVSSSDQLL